MWLCVFLCVCVFAFVNAGVLKYVCGFPCLCVHMYPSFVNKTIVFHDSLLQIKVSLKTVTRGGWTYLVFWPRWQAVQGAQCKGGNHIRDCDTSWTAGRITGFPMLITVLEGPLNRYSWLCTKWRPPLNQTCRPHFFPCDNVTIGLRVQGQ